MTKERKFSKPKFIGRERELGELKNYLDKAREGKGSTLFISGEAGIGKTRLIEELISLAETKNFKLLHGYCQKESLAPYMAFNMALKSAGLEHLTAETPSPKVDCVYLVNSAGILLSKYERTESLLDPEIFTSMLMAVGKFVKDTFRMIEGEISAGGLSGLEYKDWKILINTGADAALVAIMKGRENEFLKDDMDEIMFNVERNYGDILKTWDGDMAKVKGTEELIKPLITSGKYDGIDYARELQDPKLKMSKLYDNVLSGIIRESKKQPLLIFIDDLQWADSSTLGIIHYLARNTRKAAVMIVGAYRPEDTLATWDGKTHQLVEVMQLMGREDLLQKIELNRFPKDEMVAVLNAHFENVELSDTLFDRLYKETEGNPLFTLEVFKMLVDENIIEYDATTAVYRARAGMNIEKIKIPDKIHDVITRRLNRLEKEYRKLLDPAAVEGEYFHAETLEKILGMNRLKLLDALNTIERIHKLIRSLEDKFRFDHVKIREVIYNELNPLLRKEYHKLVGQCIEEQNRTNLSAVVVELATHYYLAEEIDKAIPYLMQAGKKAKDDFASKEAVRFYQNALEFLDRKSAAPPALDITVQKLECLEALGDIYSLAGEYDVSFSYYSVALTSANALGDKLKISDINRKIGAIYEKIGRYEKSLQYYDTALAAARATAQKGAPEPIEVARVYNEIGWTYHRKSEYDKAIEHCQKGLKLAQLHDDEKEIAVSFHMIGSNYLRKGDYNLALEFLNKGLEIRKRISDMRGISTSYNNIGVAYLRKGELDRAVEYYMKDLKISEKIGDRRGIAVSYNNIGIVYLRKGELDRGLEYYTKSLEILKKIGDLRGIAASCNNIGAVYHDKGELDCALDYYTKSLEIREKIGDMRGIAMSYNNIGAVYMERDSTGSWVAAGWFEKARNLREKIGDKSGFCESYSGLCESHARAGEINKAVEYGRKALELAREIGAKDSIAVSNKVLGIAYREMRDWSNAEKHFEESVRFYREIGQEVELAKCWYEYALMFKRRTAGADAENAEKYLQMALEMFEKRKMMGWVEKVKKAFG